MKNLEIVIRENVNQYNSVLNKGETYKVREVSVGSTRYKLVYIGSNTNKRNLVHYVNSDKLSMLLSNAQVKQLSY